MNTISCHFCGRLFTPKAPNQLYHDDKCARRAYTQRRKSRRADSGPQSNAYWSNYFAQCFTSADNTLAQQIYTAALQNPGKRYCVFNWENPEQITRPQTINVAKELHEGIEYYSIQAEAPAILAATPPNALQVPLIDEEESDLDKQLAAMAEAIRAERAAKAQNTP